MDLVEKKNENSDRHPWEIARFKILLKLFTKHTNINSNDRFTVIDIGCGDTYFAEEFLNVFSNCEYIAVDTAFSDELIMQYNKTFKEKNRNIILHKSYSDIDNQLKARCDYIFLFDVIEHIEDEVEFLKGLYNNGLLNINAQCFITVPAYESLFSSHDTFLKHFRRYNKSLLVKNIENAGLLNVSQGFFFFSLLFPRILNVIKEKIIPPKITQGIGQWKSKGVIDKLIANILVFDFVIASKLKIIGISLPGLSNFIICKKSV